MSGPVRAAYQSPKPGVGGSSPSTPAKAGPTLDLSANGRADIWGLLQAQADCLTADDFASESILSEYAVVHDRDWAMTEDLKALIEAAKKVKTTAEHREQQRRSFAYGNTVFENPRITREMIDRQAEKLKKSNDKQRP